MSAFPGFCANCGHDNRANVKACEECCWHKAGPPYLNRNAEVKASGRRFLIDLFPPTARLMMWTAIVSKERSDALPHAQGLGHGSTPQQAAYNAVQSLNIEGE